MSPRREYPLSESVRDYGRLLYAEHRFINFLKFTEFTAAEIKIIMDAHFHFSQEKDIPEKYQYSAIEMDNFIQLHTAFNNGLNGDSTINERGELKMPLISKEEVDSLYSK